VILCSDILLYKMRSVVGQAFRLLVSHLAGDAPVLQFHGHACATSLALYFVGS
jgi:hypothetical protein